MRLKKFKFEIKNLFFYFIVIIASASIGYISLGSGFEFDVYCSFQGDGTLGAMLIKSIQENGISGIWFNTRIGAPEISAFVDWPVLDILMAFIIWIISIFTTSTARIQYIYLIITFILDAVSMAWLLRKLKIDYKISFVISIIFSAAPFHFYRYIGHSVLSNYMSFPIVLYLGLYILGIIEENKKQQWKLVVATVLLGVGYGYWYAFGLILLAVAYMMVFIKSVDKKVVLKKLWIIGLLLGVILLTLLPKMVYATINGANELVGQRSPVEQEIYGLKIVQLLLPPSYSRFEFLRNITALYNSHAPLVNENSTASLGLIASIGFLILCIMFIYSFISKEQKKKEVLFIDYLSFSTLVLILMGSIGGVGEIFNALVTAQIRCYNRSSIFIAGLSLVMVAYLLNKIELKKWGSYVVCTVILVIGMVDQVAISASNWQDGNKEIQKVYEEFFCRLEENVEENDMVFQLPYMDFPEVGSINNMSDYAHFKAYIFTDTIKWSYGGIKGRNTVAKELYCDNGMSKRFLCQLKDAGFSGVYIDVDGYADGGAEIVGFYNSLGIEPIISADEKLYFYDISDFEISLEECSVEYGFVEKIGSIYGEGLDKADYIEVSEKMKLGDTLAGEIIYSWIEDDVNNLPDNEYVHFLYSAILGRDENNEENAGWVSRLNVGESRESLFWAFYHSEEFSNKYRSLTE